MGKKSEHLYLKLAEHLIEQIRGGAYSEGSLLPSERELCEEFSISRTTVRQALQELQNRGYARSIHGKGTVVVHAQIQQDLTSIYSFDRDMRRLGKVPETRIMDFIEMRADEVLSDMFGLPEGSAVYRVMRLRLADGEPMLLETNFLPCYRFPALSRDMLENQSLYGVLSSTYNLDITVAEETFEPVILSPMETQFLGSDKDTLGMLVQRTSFEKGRVVELSKSVSPSYKFKQHVILKR